MKMCSLLGVIHRQKIESFTYAIIYDINRLFKSVYLIKEETWEKNYIPEVYKINKSYYGDYYMNEQRILQVPDAIVSDRSDIIITSLGVIWDKAYQENFPITIPTDINLLSYSANNVKICKYKTVNHIQGDVVSLLGVPAHIWSHFIIQYLPKLYFAYEAGLLNKEITILLPMYNDSQIKQIVEDFVRPFDLVHTIYVDSSVYYKCDTLYWIPSSSYVANNANIIHPSMLVIPKIVFEKLSLYLGKRYTKDIILDDALNTKIYLIRRTGYRLLQNIDEVEDFFKSEGFVFVDPGSLSLEEKARIFYQARIIAGPLSSAFTNVVFSQPGVKVLELTNMIRTLDTYATLFPAMDVRSIYVTGEDISGSVHSDYVIPINKIKTAYKYLLTI